MKLVDYDDIHMCIHNMFRYIYVYIYNIGAWLIKKFFVVAVVESQKNCSTKLNSLHFHIYYSNIKQICACLVYLLFDHVFKFHL